MSFVALLRDANQAGTMMMPLKNIGPKRVAITNHFDRTRSRYSPLYHPQSLAMSAHSLFHSAPQGARARSTRGGTNLLQEDLM